MADAYTYSFIERSKINAKQIPFLMAIALTVFSWPPNASPQDGARFDFIIVGAGSAGAVLAHRLSEDGSRTVLLIENGPDPPFLSVVPGFFTFMPGTQFEYGYNSVRDLERNTSRALAGGRLHYTQGKMLGGSSSLNYMLYVRGNKADYDGWATLGYKGWDYETLLPYFMKSEGLQVKGLLRDPKYSTYHNGDGLLKVSQPKLETIHEMKTNSILEAMSEIGIPTLDDYNGPVQLGGAKAFFTQKGVRMSTAEGFLRNISHLENLVVFKETEVKRVFISNGRAHGVEVVHNGDTMKFFAEREVIVSAGAINSPKVLIASGVGPKDDLAKLNVSQAVDLPVGRNLLDHLYVPVILLGAKNKKSKYPVFNFSTVPVPFTIYFVLSDSEGQPQIQFVIIYFDQASPMVYQACIALGFRRDVCAAWVKLNLKREIFLVSVILLHPKSTGKVNISSLDKDPEIHPGYFSHPEDLKLVIEGITLLAKLNETKFFQDAGARTLFGNVGLPECRHLRFATDEYWSCYAIALANTVWHPAATCAMGKVVDDRLKVLGVDGLRVVDASVFPTLTSGNTNAPTIMLAERAADLIKEDYSK